MKVGLSFYYLHFYRKSDKSPYARRNLYQIGKIVKEAGFECVESTITDIILTQLGGNKSNDPITEAYNVREYFDKLGLEFEKTHSRFRTSFDPAFDWKSMREENLCQLDYAKALGAKYFVVHADTYAPQWGTFNPDDALDAAYEYLAPLVEKGKKLGVGIAVETLFEEGQVPDGRLRYTSTSDEVIAVIDKFNDPAVTCCLDIGHAAIAYGTNLLDEIKKIGSRISCLHVQDNNSTQPVTVIPQNFVKDMHLPLFEGSLDWEGIIGTLKEIGYKGDFTLEACHLLYPEALVVDNLNMIYKNAKYAVDNF